MYLGLAPRQPCYNSLPRAVWCCALPLQVGEFVCVALSSALPAWHHLLIACGALNVASLLLYFLVPESGRWLLSRGRTEEARAFLERLAKANGSHMPAEPLVSSHSAKQLPEDVEAAAAAAQGPGLDGSMASTDKDASSEAGAEVQGEAPPVRLADLLRSPRLSHRLLILLINAFTLSANYYGISMGVGAIPGPM